MAQDLLERFGRRLRLGMVGGGRDSVIGGSHLIAMRADGLCELVAGAMSVDPGVALESGRSELVAEDRIYLDYRQMAESEAARADGIDAVVVATPPHLHYPVSRAFLELGIDVICEKPLCRDYEEALELRDLVARHERLFCVTHCYTGYPIVRQARAMVAAGKLGKIRLIEGELCAGDPGVATEPEDPAKRHWRFRKDSMGTGAILGEVASHAHHIVTYVTGLQVIEVSAELTTFADRREVYDNSYVTARFQNGARGRIWGSYMAAGNDHGLSFRVYGEKAGIRWDQEEPEILWFKAPGEPARRIARGYDTLSSEAAAATRLRPGHPEGYALAFANLYADFARAVMARSLGAPHKPYLERIPGVEDGVEVMALIDATVRSHAANGAWTEIPSISLR